MPPNILNNRTIEPAIAACVGSNKPTIRNNGINTEVNSTLF